MSTEQALLAQLKLVERIIQSGGDKGVTRRAKEMKARLNLPMRQVLAKVPGRSNASKARFLNVSRMSYYDWLNGVNRPGKKMAAKLAKVTGYDAAAIRGLVPDPDARSSAR